MPGPRTFDAGADHEQIIETVRADGAAILTDVLDPAFVAALNAELDPWVAASPDGRDDFSGRLTKRTGALVARSPLCRDVVMQPDVIGLANMLIGEFTERIQLHLTQVISIAPGQGAQELHRDRLAWGGFVPRAIEPQFNTIWALTDFTEENGATNVAVGSPSWESERKATSEELTQAVMKAGSVLLYSGSVVHGGGENRTEVPRRGLNITYTLGWLRTEENQYLSCPPSVAKDLDPALQELLGYTMGSYALGYFSDPGEVLQASDLLPPELALGRKPRRDRSSA
ncbi:MAG: phytanoyl-CoA dioxygenase family protein [Acidimicrobiales bacterium]